MKDWEAWLAALRVVAKSDTTAGLNNNNIANHMKQLRYGLKVKRHKKHYILQLEMGESTKKQA